MNKLQRLYTDQDGFLIKAATGSCQRAWAVYRVKENGFLQRIKTRELPARGSFEEAQDDLDHYAQRMGWEMLARL
ncbi:MAG: hypothetical protein ACYDHV_13070 [Desulfurivibrionaceae bacterium]